MPVKKIFAIEHPELLEEWDYAKNAGLYDPNKEGCSSFAKVSWICKKCGYSWEASIRSRTGTNKTGCPCCAGRVVWKGHNDLQTVDPERAAQWDYSRNSLNPTDVTVGSNRRVFWICPDCGESWQASVGSSHGKTLCRRCAKRVQIVEYKRTVLRSGANSIASKYPDIAKEWMFEKNGGTTPSDVVPNTNDVYWWQCSICNHEYQRSVLSRVQGSGCPKCKRRFQTSFPEQAIYYYVKSVFPDSVNGKHPTWLNLSGKQNYEIDIYIPSIKTGIEYDGFAWHKNKENTDVRKGKLIKENGVKLFRIRENGLSVIDDGSFSIILSKNDKTYINLSNGIIELFKVLSIDNSIDIPDIDVNRDRFKIIKQFISEKKNDSIAVMYPELLNEWNYQENYPLMPEQVSAGTDLKIHWICQKCGYKWQTEPYNRCINHTGCKRCAGKVLWPGHNDFATKRPELMPEWDREKNSKEPTEVTYMSNFKAHWICSKCKIPYSSLVSDRSKGVGCPYCAHKYVISGKNDLKTLYPDIAAMWDYSKNGDKLPENYLPQSNVPVYWKCPKCGVSQLVPIYSKIKKPGCCFCAGHRLLKGVNDLATVFPIVASEWDYSKNTIHPDEVHCGSKKRCAWICSKCGHEWWATVYDRTKGGHGCQECSHRKGSKAVLQLNDSGDLIREYSSISEASAETGINRVSISSVLRGKTKHAGGYIWKYN